MIDDKEIEEEARYYWNNRYPASQDAPCIAEGFRKGAKWAVNEFLKNLWHPAYEEPKKNGEPYQCPNEACGINYFSLEKVVG